MVTKSLKILLVQRFDRGACEVVREDFLMPIFAICHHCRPDLAKSHAVSPSRTDQAESGWILGRFSACDLNYKRRAVQVRARKCAANLQFLADHERSLLTRDPQPYDSTRLSALDGDQRPEPSKVHSKL